jgi:hypothetical protein
VERSNRGAIEQPRAKIPLELAHTGRDGRLDDMQPLGGAREAALFGDREERCDLSQLHHVIAGGDNHQQLFALIAIVCHTILSS